jgi:hypothetical protein
MDDFGKRGDGDAPPEDLAAIYRGDPREDAIDTAAGWASLRPGVTRRPAPRRRRVFIAALAASLALAASVVFMVRATSDALRTATTPSVEYLKTVTDLEAALRAGRERLRPETAASIEQSLAAIDRAIRDAEATLAADPGNTYVADWLDAIRRRKLSALRQVVTDLHAIS